MPTIPFSTGIQPRTQVIMLLVGVAMLLVVLQMVRRGRIREQYALLWIVAAVVIAGAAVFIRDVEWLSHLVGVYYPPAFLFLLAILLLFVLQLHVSTVISNLREQNRSLVQDLGLLSTEVRELRQALQNARPEASPGG